MMQQEMAYKYDRVSTMYLPGPKPRAIMETLWHSLRRTLVNSYFLLLYLFLMSPMNRKFKYYLQVQDDFSQVGKGGISWSISSMLCGRATDFFLPKSLQLGLCFQTAKGEYHENIDSQINSSFKAAITRLGQSTRAAGSWEEEKVALQSIIPFHRQLLKLQVTPLWLGSISVLLILADRKSHLKAFTAGCCYLLQTLVPSIPSSPIRLSQGQSQTNIRSTAPHSSPPHLHLPNLSILVPTVLCH